jgi:hypothetical protein
MERKLNVQRLMRSLHRDLGFLTVGFAIVYALSGILLTYRDTDFLKQEVIVEKIVEPNLSAEELGRLMHLRNMKVLAVEGDVVQYREGTYNKATGEIIFTSKVLPEVLQKFTSLHKSSSQQAGQWLNLVFGSILLFLAVSSYWMFKKNTSQLRRGIYISAGGFLVILIVLIF